jgi:hypothetical protein
MDTGPVENQAPLVLGVIISMLALGGIFIFARVITRTLIKPQFGWDDGLIVVTWVCMQSTPLNHKERSE